MKKNPITEVQCVQGAYETWDMFRLAKLILVNLLLMTLLLTSSCKKENTFPVAEESMADTSFVAIKNYLIYTYGFEEKSIQETKDGFIVEGDIFFPKLDFWKNYTLTSAGQANGRHYRTSSLVTRVTTIKVCFNANVPSSWKTAYRNAFTQWNSLNGKLKFVETTTQWPMYGIQIQYAYLGWSNPYATTYYPVAGAPGSSSIINSSIAILTNSNQKLYTAIHELGHAIGFAHTDVSSGATLISTANVGCNTYSDLYSVMKPTIPSGSSPWSSFSTCDKAAYKKLYPL
jgi:hypothetical protein